MKIRCVRPLMLFRAQHPNGMGYERGESELSERKRVRRRIISSFFLFPRPMRRCWWKFERFYSVARFTSRRFSVSPSFLSGEFSESVYPRNASRKFGHSPMNIGRSINFKTDESESVVPFCRRVTSSLTFGTPDSNDVIITELNPKRQGCHRGTKLIVDLPSLSGNLAFREFRVSTCYTIVKSHYTRLPISFLSHDRENTLYIMCNMQFLQTVP